MNTSLTPTESIVSILFLMNGDLSAMNKLRSEAAKMRDIMEQYEEHTDGNRLYVFYGELISAIDAKLPADDTEF